MSWADACKVHLCSLSSRRVNGKDISQLNALELGMHHVLQGFDKDDMHNVRWVRHTHSLLIIQFFVLTSVQDNMFPVPEQTTQALRTSIRDIFASHGLEDAVVEVDYSAVSVNDWSIDAVC